MRYLTSEAVRACYNNQPKYTYSVYTGKNMAGNCYICCGGEMHFYLSRKSKMESLTDRPRLRSEDNIKVDTSTRDIKRATLKGP
jgi:hypothetical protein